MRKVKADEWNHITISMKASDVWFLDQLREDLSRSAYIRQLIKKEAQYR